MLYKSTADNRWKEHIDSVIRIFNDNKVSYNQQGRLLFMKLGGEALGKVMDLPVNDRLDLDSLC